MINMRKEKFKLVKNGFTISIFFSSRILKKDRKQRLNPTLTNLS